MYSERGRPSVPPESAPEEPALDRVLLGALRPAVLRAAGLQVPVPVVPGPGARGRAGTAQGPGGLGPDEIHDPGRRVRLRGCRRDAPLRGAERRPANGDRDATAVETRVPLGAEAPSGTSS